MKVYTFTRKQKLPISLDEAWEFFSNPKNLARITPPDMGFEIKHISGSDTMYMGQIIKYNVRVLAFLKMEWVSEISTVNKPFLFIDDQRSGPYKLWHHQHHFQPCEDGIEMIDEINYSVPMGVLGRIANWLFVARELERIFEYRTRVVLKIFNG